MKQQIARLLSLLGITAPIVLGMSGSLPGTGETSEPSGISPDEIVKDINMHLDSASDAIEHGKINRAKKYLRRSDELTSRMDPHTHLFDKVSKRKSKLWEKTTKYENK